MGCVSLEAGGDGKAKARKDEGNGGEKGDAEKDADKNSGPKEKKKVKKGEVSSRPERMDRKGGSGGGGGPLQGTAE